ncbi:MAG: DegQ family serine endoprotease [Ottowia sp.]|nr:DegQ family serine endoprotease [Ottowia sp.]
MHFSDFSCLRRVVLAAALACASLGYIPTLQAASASNADIPDLVEKAGPAVVNIRTMARVRVQTPGAEGDEMAELFRRFFGEGIPGFPMPRVNPPLRRSGPPTEEEQNRGIGSGFIISADGFVMTNSHVVDGASSIYVTLSDKREFKAKLIGLDKRTDVALVKIDATQLQTLPLGDSDKIRVGESVLAIGSPFGLENTVTSGIISAKSRETGDYLPFIQTDVAVNPGNSGGPLINMKGEVIGINSQIFTRSGGSMGISFAIPIDEAMRVVTQLKATGRVSRSRIGVSIGEVTKDVAESLGLGKARGALVRGVEAGSPAERAGVEAGDIIVRFNTRDINKSTDLPRIVGETKPGTTAMISVWRKGVLKERSVTVVEAEDSKQSAVGPSGQNHGDEDEASPNALGLVIADVPEARQRELKIKGGVLVQLAEGPAARVGLQPGDLILRIGDVDITSAKQFEQIVRGLDKNKAAALFVRRGDATQVVPIRPNRENR